MSGNIDSLWAGFEHDLQKVVTVKPQYRPSVGVDIADSFQLFGKELGRLKAWQQNDAVHLAHPTVFFVD